MAQACVPWACVGHILPNSIRRAYRIERMFKVLHKGEMPRECDGWEEIRIGELQAVGLLSGGVQLCWWRESTASHTTAAWRP